jgi:hypothetical protein
MLMLFAGLFLYFAVRAFLYFSNGRAFAGLFASLACLLFLGGIYVDIAQHGKAPAGVVKRTA